MAKKDKFFGYCKYCENKLKTEEVSGICDECYEKIKKRKKLIDDVEKRIIGFELTEIK